MTIDYTPTDPVAGESRAVSKTEVERWVDYADTIADVDTRINARVSLTGAETIAGVKTFSSSPVVPAPTTDLQAATKKYADDLAATKVAQTTFPVVLGFAISDETTALTAGTSKLTARAPFAFTLTAVRATLTTASTSGTPTFDINESGTSVLSTKLTIDATEKTSTTAATAAVISDSAIADDAELTFDIDASGTDAAGAKLWLIGTRDVS